MSEREMLVMMRRQKGLNQHQLAEAIGTKQPIISMFERGRRKLTSESYAAYKNFIVAYNPEENKGGVSE